MRLIFQTQIKYISILFVLQILCPFILLSQSGDDGYNIRILNQYDKDIEVARQYILLQPGFNTEGHSSFLAYIDPDLPFNGGNAVSNGEFNHNYIRVFNPINNTYTNVVPTHNNIDINEWSEEITYFDGIGRPMQKINVMGTPSLADIVKPITYDQHGRKKEEYLAYSIIQDGSNGPGGARPNATDEAKSYFSTFFGQQDGSYPYNDKVYDNSPLNIVTKETEPGYDWRIQGGNFIENVYNTNTSSDNIYRFTIESGNQLKKVGIYNSGKLLSKKKIDEDGNISYEYFDFEDRVVAKLVECPPDNLITYYAYDKFGNLRYVLPPKAIDNLPSGSTSQTYTNTTDWIKELCFYYEYDKNKRMIQKRIPGSDPVYMVYDKRNRVCLTQDGNLEENHCWFFTKYDQFNRPILHGIYNHGMTATQEYMQSIYDGSSYPFLFETFSVSNPDFGGYTNNCFPVLDVDDDVLKIYYYDSYDFLSHSSNIGEYSFLPNEINFINDKTDNVLNLKTAEVTMTLEHSSISFSDSRLLKVNYYDKYKRIIQLIEDNHLGGYDVISKNYNVNDKVIDTKHRHSVSGNDIIIKKTYQYDQLKRITSCTHQIGGQSPVVLFKNEYDETGNIKRKKIHTNEQGSTNVQCLKYLYNIRGWITDLNNVEKIDDDLFAMRLFYNLGDNSFYNGNISKWSWLSSNFPEFKMYTYSYDGANRLKTATFYSNNKYDALYSYDKNGNILTITRNGQLGESPIIDEIDDLSFDYIGNQLNFVNDELSTSHQNYGFSDNGSFLTTNEYLYDNNGNLTKDLNKQIESITYSYNNLPQRIELTQAGQNLIHYVYNADGDKLFMQTRIDQVIEKSIDYVGDFVYANGNLKYVLTENGRVTLNNEVWEYEYFITDHLGNVRVLFDENKNVLQDYSYYPYGMSLDGLAFTAPECAPTNKLLYNSKEFHDSFNLDWYHYGTRFYDPQLGRWNMLDPKSKDYFNWSPYNYSLNNPIKYIDPDGNNVVNPQEPYKQGKTSSPFYVPNIRNSFIVQFYTNQFEARMINILLDSYEGNDRATVEHYMHKIILVHTNTEYGYFKLDMQELQKDGINYKQEIPKKVFNLGVDQGREKLMGKGFSRHEDAGKLAKGTGKIITGGLNVVQLVFDPLEIGEGGSLKNTKNTGAMIKAKMLIKDGLKDEMIMERIQSAGQHSMNNLQKNINSKSK